MKRYDYLIIGNSAGGVGAMEAIRNIDKDGSLAVISSEKHHVYSRPLISYYLADEISRDKMFYRPDDFYEKNNIDAILNKKALKINSDEHSVTLDSGDQIGFGKLLLATGGKPFVPPIKGLEKYETFTFITLDDSDRIREKIERENIKNVVVLGGGLIGLKAAEGLTHRGVHVKVLELADRILSPVLDKQAAGMIQSVLEEQGIEIITEQTIEEITGEDGKVNGVILKNGKRIDCDMVIVAIGVRPRTELADDTPIEVARGIKVDKMMRTSIPEIYACGDCAEVYDFIAVDFRLTPLWPTAHVGGRVAGSNMAGVEKEYVWGTGMNAVDFFGFPVISAGIVNPLADSNLDVLATIDPLKRTYRKFTIRNNRVVGMILVNEVDRAGVILGLMRDKVDIMSFRDELLSGDFGMIDLPRGLRDQLDATTNRGEGEK